MGQTGPEDVRGPDPFLAVDPLPVRVDIVDGEALDGYLERVAYSNFLDNAQLTALLREVASTTFLALSPDPQLLSRLSLFTNLPVRRLRKATLAAMAGINLIALDATDRRTWRKVASHGWAPRRGTAICPDCLAEDGIWKTAWRHPWVTACPRHQVSLVQACPRCRGWFRSQTTPLRTVDALPGTCGNPKSRRGNNCCQEFAMIPTATASAEVLSTQKRIATATHHRTIHTTVGTRAPETYLADLKALSALLLHLAASPHGAQLVDWSKAARSDRDRSAGCGGPRWAQAPPQNCDLRGRVLATADRFLQTPFDDAVDDFRRWAATAPDINGTRLKWMSDHTKSTPMVARLISAAARRRSARGI